jgi:hypothetical protein
VAGMSTVLVGELRVSIPGEPDGQLFIATFPELFFLSLSNDMKIQNFPLKHPTVQSYMSLKKINKNKKNKNPLAWFEIPIIYI